MEPEPSLPGPPFGHQLTGHVVEWNELLAALDERPGLTVVSADPFSGASQVVAGVLPSLDAPHVLVDARGSSDALDLAMAIADAAVAALAPNARNWWIGDAPPSSREGLRLWRALGEAGLDPENIRLGSGAGRSGLEDALRLITVVTENAATLAIDHLGVMLASLRDRARREILDVLRTSRQRNSALDLVLVDHVDGLIDQALDDPQHPLFQAGVRVRITRPTPDRFIDDLAVTRPIVEGPVPFLRVAAELAAGVPAVIWRIAALAPASGEDSARAVAGWRTLRTMSEPSVTKQWDLLRRVHPAAPSLVAALSLGLPPHSVPVASKSVDDGLNRLRDMGLAWQPEPRRWALADPLLAAFARDHAPPWARRRSGHARRIQFQG